MALTHRLQLLLEDAQYQRLAKRSETEHRSIGSLVREAIDLAWSDVELDRFIAGEVILRAERMPMPGPEELRREREEARGLNRK
jgi:predicted DNA-binding protein